MCCSPQRLSTHVLAERPPSSSARVRFCVPLLPDDDNGVEEEDEDDDDEDDDDEEEDGDDTAATGDDGLEEGDLQFELENMLPLADMTPLVNTAGSEDVSERPCDIEVGHRVKWRIGRTTAASATIPGLTKAAPGNAGANILNDAIHGIVRAIVGRNVKVQWFCTTVDKQLHLHAPALIYVLFPDEFSLDIERRFAPIHE